MIRAYCDLDRRRINLNEYSREFSLDYLGNDPDVYRQTLVDAEDVPRAIVCFQRYWKNNFIAWFLIDTGLDWKGARELRRFVYQAAADFGAERIQTDSLNCDTINRWHGFLGFTNEGCRRKYIDGKDFNMWAWVR